MKCHIPLARFGFLRVLIFCVLISPIVFLLSKSRPHLLFLPILLAIILSFIQSFYAIHKWTNIGGHNFFQSIVYGAYFFIGAIVYRKNWREGKLAIGILMAICLAVSILTLYLQKGSTILSDHAYAPDWFFFFLGIFGILLVLLLANLIEKLVIFFPGLQYFLKYCSKHAYGIYLNHSFFIVFFESIFDLKDVSTNFPAILAKIILVISFSLAFSIPITHLSNYIIRKFRFALGLADQKRTEAGTFSR